MPDDVETESEHEGESEHHCVHCDDIAQIRESVTGLASQIATTASETEDAAYEAIGELFEIPSEVEHEVA